MPPPNDILVWVIRMNEDLQFGDMSNTNGLTNNPRRLRGSTDETHEGGVMVRQKYKHGY